MPINLYKHNKEAYENVKVMLRTEKKAAVVHPTGTGKSFIAFKLCEDNADKKVCWLSPSEYIFGTQIENLKKAANGYVPENIVFFTYAKLMNLSVEEIAEIKPEYIVLDEFHRCGANMWSKGVFAFLKKYHDVPVLGLSATAVRYLDNRRDMSAELFDGCIASEMTLGEAIVRGILNPPKYVLSVFRYKKYLEKYEKRIEESKSKIVREEGWKILEAMRRRLEQADGMEEIFSKHITDRCGKYIVFCANYQHMREMISLSEEWFAKIDKHPHIYFAYSNDAYTSKAFADFKADNSGHLKLLYCIDMLNEGIHLEDISGVILLRPTVSPIIYKQQIGRALSAAKSTTPVIFDIVMNVENLYSIGEIAEEMQSAATYYRLLGEESLIVNEHFRLVDEIHDCVKLFGKLENILSASWDLMYDVAVKYREEHGHLEVPSRYFSEEGYSLGRWIYNQRNIKKGILPGKLTDEQVKKLDEIGMRWDLYTDFSWEKNYGAAFRYFEKHGNLDVPSRYVTKDGVRLGEWLSNLRTWESSGTHPKYLTEERKKTLEKLGMIWSKLDFYWENNFAAALKYYRENLHLAVPSNYVTDDGIRLGSWICRQRKLRKGQCKGTPPTEEQIKRLDDIGMSWEFNVTRKWDKAYAFAKKYFETNGDLLVPSSHRTETGFCLGQWVKNQRAAYFKGTLQKTRRQLLERIGMVWQPPDSWHVKYEMVKEYLEKHGDVCISRQYTVNGVWLGKWLAVQKKLYAQKKTLTPEQRKLLEQLPHESENSFERAWYAAYAEAEEYFLKNNDLKVPSGYKTARGIKLSDWIIRQRRARRENRLGDEKVKLLDKIGFVWELPSVWEEGYRHAKEYFETFGNLDMQKAYKCSDGYALGQWVFNYRNARNRNKSPVNISSNQEKMLEQIGMVWQPKSTWDKRFSDILEFVEKRGRLPKTNAEDDFEKKLRQWLNNQRNNYRRGGLKKYQIDKLSLIGVGEQWLAPQNGGAKALTMQKRIFPQTDAEKTANGLKYAAEA